MSLATIDRAVHINPPVYEHRAATEDVKCQSRHVETKTSYLGQSVTALLAEVIELSRQYVSQIEMLQCAASLLDQQLRECMINVSKQRLESATAELSSKLSLKLSTLVFGGVRKSFEEFSSLVKKLLDKQIETQQHPVSRTCQNTWQYLTDLQQCMSDQLTQTHRLGLDIYRTLTQAWMSDPQNLEDMDIAGHFRPLHHQRTIV